MSKAAADIEQPDEFLAPKPAGHVVAAVQKRLSRKTAAFCVVALVCFLLLLPSLRCFASAAYGVAFWHLLQPELRWAKPVPDGKQPHYRVPAILHQTWKNREIPSKWQAAQKSCVDLHPDYEYRLWTDADALEFIEEHYPWFLPTYLAYPYDIQRADVIRYFVLYHFGGIYMDLDMGCRKDLGFLRQYNFTAPLTYPGGISNDVLAAAPGDAFLGDSLGQLARWNRWMGIRYVQVMFSTGPMFLSTQYSLYDHRDQVAIIPPQLYGKYNTSGDAAFYHLHGSSWHGNDAWFVFWLDTYKTPLIVVGCALAAGHWVRCLLRLRRTRAAKCCA